MGRVTRAKAPAKASEPAPAPAPAPAEPPAEEAQQKESPVVVESNDVPAPEPVAPDVVPDPIPVAADPGASGADGGAAGERVPEGEAVVAGAEAPSPQDTVPRAELDACLGAIADLSRERDVHLLECAHLQQRCDEYQRDIAEHERVALGLRGRVAELEDEVKSLKDSNAQLLLSVNPCVLSIQDPLPRGTSLVLFPRQADIIEGAVTADKPLFAIVSKLEPRVIAIRPQTVDRAGTGTEAQQMQEFFAARGYRV